MQTDSVTIPSASPPPLPKLPVESGWHTYLRAAGLLFPGVVFVNYSALILVPKLEHIWSKAGPDINRAHWMLEGSCWLPSHFRMGIALVAPSLVALELMVPGFPRWRSRITTLVVIAFNLAVLTTLAGISTSALLAAPLLQKEHRQAPVSAVPK